MWTSLMLGDNAETCMACYATLDLRRAMRYRCGSGVFLFFHIGNELVQTRDEKCRRSREFLELFLRHA